MSPWNSSFRSLIWPFLVANVTAPWQHSCKLSPLSFQSALLHVTCYFLEASLTGMIKNITAVYQFCTPSKSQYFVMVTTVSIEDNQDVAVFAGTYCFSILLLLSVC